MCSGYAPVRSLVSSKLGHFLLQVLCKPFEQHADHKSEILAEKKGDEPNNLVKDHERSAGETEPTNRTH